MTNIQIFSIPIANANYALLIIGRICADRR